MAKPLGYFNLDVINNSLLRELAATWGQSLENMGEIDCLFMISQIALQMFEQKEGVFNVSEDAMIASQRIVELEDWQKLALIRALVQEA